MKVRCIKIISPATGEELVESGWVQIGYEYVVIAIAAVPRKSVQFQILTEDSTPSWWDSQMFVTVSSRIPSNWVALISSGGNLDVAPQPWLEPGFWEKYFDGDAHAREVFDEELVKILSEV